MGGILTIIAILIALFVILFFLGLLFPERESTETNEEEREEE